MRLSVALPLLATVAIATSLVLFPAPSPAPSPTPRAKPDPRVLLSSAVNHQEAYSNILPEDYLGPESCAECHKEQYRKWKEHPHHCMNQLPSSQSVMANFQDAEVVLPVGKATFTTSADGRYEMSLFRDGELFRRYVVTRTVGSKYMQQFIGRQTFGPEPAGDKIYDEHMLPFGYWFALGRWLPKDYLDPYGPERVVNGIPLVDAFNCTPESRSYTKTCMNCHNTMAYSYRLFNPMLAGFPHARVAATIEPLSAIISRTTPVEATPRDFLHLNGRLDPDQHLASLGISCESCHFGGREHVKHQRKTKFIPTSKFVQISARDPEKHVTDSRQNAHTMLGICIQCHSGNGKYYANGMSKGNAREAIDFHLSKCSSQMRCVDCHEPHTKGTLGGAPDKPDHVAQCVRCHDKYQDETTVAAHTRHAAGSTSCLDCHMPRTVQGLTGLLRSHRIGPSVDASMVATGAVNACNTCHVDKSLRWTITELKKGWNKEIVPQADWQTASQLDIPAGDLWMSSTDSALRIVGTQSYATSRVGKTRLSELARALDDPNPLNRVFGIFAVSRIQGADPANWRAVSITATPTERRAQINAWLATQELPPLTFPPQPEVTAGDLNERDGGPCSGFMPGTEFRPPHPQR